MKTKTLVFRILMGAVLLALGVLTLVRTEGFVRVLVVVCGAWMVCGSLFGFFSAPSFAPFFETSLLFSRMNLVSNIVGLAFGLFAVIAPFAWARVVGAALFWIAALYLLFSSFVSFRIYLGLRKAGAAYIPKNLVVEALCDLLLALLLIFLPGEVARTVLTVLGIVLIASGVLVIALTVAYKINFDRRHAGADEVERLN